MDLAACNELSVQLYPELMDWLLHISDTPISGPNAFRGAVNRRTLKKLHSWTYELPVGLHGAYVLSIRFEWVVLPKLTGKHIAEPGIVIGARQSTMTHVIAAGTIGVMRPTCADWFIALDVKDQLAPKLLLWIQNLISVPAADTHACEPEGPYPSVITACCRSLQPANPVIAAQVRGGRSLKFTTKVDL